jgi:hypothetical protein
MKVALQRFGDNVARTWCRMMHPDPMWPVRGMYQCPRCFRKFPVPWEEHKTAPISDVRKQISPQPVLVDTLRNVPERIHA